MGSYYQGENNHASIPESFFPEIRKNRFLYQKEKEIFHFNVNKWNIVSMSLSRPLFPKEEEGI